MRIFMVGTTYHVSAAVEHASKIMAGTIEHASKIMAGTIEQRQYFAKKKSKKDELT